MATHDAKGPATFKANADKAAAAIAALEKVEMPDSVRALIAPVKTALAGYAASFGSISTNLLKSNDLFEKDMRPQLVQLVAGIGTAKASLQQAAAETRKQTDEAIATTVMVQEVMAGVALLLGGLIAFFVGRSIVKPVSGMTDAMQSSPPATMMSRFRRANTDEIGSMAKAVEVFKQNAIERIRLEAEQLRLRNVRRPSARPR